jgi:hypothetical protein
VETETVPTQVSFTFRASPYLEQRRYDGALRQDSRLVWACGHAHAARLEALSCARAAADSWPGRKRWLAGPCRAEQFALPVLPTLAPARVRNDG